MAILSIFLGRNKNYSFQHEKAASTDLSNIRTRQRDFWCCQIGDDWCEEELAAQEFGGDSVSLS